VQVKLLHVGRLHFEFFKLKKFFSCFQGKKTVSECVIRIGNNHSKTKKKSEDAVTRGGLRLWGPWLKL